MADVSCSLLFSGALLLWAATICASDLESLDGSFTSHDLDRLRDILKSAEPYSDVATAYHMLQGLKAIGATEMTEVIKKNACSFSQSHLDTSDINNIFYVSSIAATVGKDCLSGVAAKKTKIQTLLEQSLEGEPSMEAIYRVVSSMINLGIKVNSERILTFLTTVLENEESIYDSGLAFLTAALLKEGELSEIFALVEDIVAQADETATTLYYENLQTTATVVTGIFALSARVEETPAITAEQATKFGNYLMSNKYLTDISDVATLLTAVSALGRNEVVVPSCLHLSSTAYVSKANPMIQVRLSTILGSAPPTSFTVALKSIEDSEGVEKTINKPLKKEKSGIYSYNLFNNVTGPGVYILTFSSKANTKSPVVEFKNAKLQVTVSFSVTVGSAKLSLVDLEHGSTTRAVSLDYPNLSTEILDADQHSKVIMTFTLLNKETNSAVQVHQAFVRLSLGSMEMFFVAMPDKKTSLYTFDLDMAASASDFGQLSGTYSIALIVGDFALENPFSWDVGSVNLVFPKPPTEQEKEDHAYKPRPEIQHLFRPDEKLPSQVISSTFSILVLTPLVILLFMWLAVGVNASGFGTGGFWTPIFHLGLGGIFAVYYLFWVKLNMFDTLKLLALLSVPTFIAGNRMLRQIAKENKPTSR